MNIPGFDPSIRLIILTIGLPGSGKTTWALDLVSNEPNRWCRVNRDDLRLMLTGKLYEPGNYMKEKLVTECSESLIRRALESGRDVVIDNTSLDGKARKAFHLIAQEFGAVVVEKVFNVPLELVLFQNQRREESRRVPNDVIHGMAKRYNVDKNGNFKGLKDRIVSYERTIQHLEQDRSLQPTIICDLDGTLSLLNGRDPYDASTCDQDLLNEPIAIIVRSWYSEKHPHNSATPIPNGPYDPPLRIPNVIFMSGRSDEYRDQTMKFIGKHLCAIVNKNNYELHMRAKGDQRKDTVVKKELYEKHVKGKYFVEFALDDRDSIVNLWRSMGLTCLQVNYGNF